MRRGSPLLGIIFPFFLPLILLTVALLAFTIVGSIQPAVQRHTAGILRENAYFLRDLTAPLLADKQMRFHLRAFSRIERSPSRIVLYDPQGHVISSSGIRPEQGSTARAVGARMVERALAGHEEQRLVMSEAEGMQRIYLTVPVYAPTEERLVGAVKISTSLADITRGFETIYRLIFYLTVGMLAIAFLSSHLLARRIATPLANLVQAARRYGSLEFRYRPFIGGPAEFQEAAKALGDSVEAVDLRLQRLVHEKEELQTVFQGMVEGVIVLDNHLTIKELNPAVAALLRIDSRRSRGKNLIHVVRHSELHDIAEQAVREERLIERSIQLPLSHSRTDLEPRLPASARIRGYMHLRIHASCITTDILEQGSRRQQKRVILVLNDITRLKNLERMRKDFVSNVSHELKTPITSIKGFTETLKEDPLGSPETTRRFIGIIHHHTERLEAIIEDLLSLSRLEREEGTEVEKEPTYAAVVVERCLRSRSARAEEKGISLHRECAEEIKLNANASLLEQALLNLVDNAVKYCSGGCNVTVSCGEADEEVFFRVADNGPGIPARELGRIFERFYRVDKTRSRELGGTGLGLAIVKHIAIAHAGTIDVQSTEGAGTTFVLTLPRGLD